MGFINYKSLRVFTLDKSKEISAMHVNNEQRPY